MVPRWNPRALSYCLGRQPNKPLCHLEFLVFQFELFHFRLEKAAGCFAERRARERAQAWNRNRRANGSSDERKCALRETLQCARERKSALRKKPRRAPHPLLDLLEQAAQEVVQLFFRAHTEQLSRHFFLLRFRHEHFGRVFSFELSFQFIHFAELIHLTGVLKLELT